MQVAVAEKRFAKNDVVGCWLLLIASVSSSVFVLIFLTGFGISLLSEAVLGAVAIYSISLLIVFGTRYLSVYRAEQNSKFTWTRFLTLVSTVGISWAVIPVWISIADVLQHPAGSSSGDTLMAGVLAALLVAGATLVFSLVGVLIVWFVADIFDQISDAPLEAPQ